MGRVGYNVGMVNKSPFEIKEVRAKSILVKCGIPGIDFVINPYTGCRFGCAYCYASFMSRYVGKNTSDWGEFVYAKVNAPDLLREALRKLKNKGKGIEIFFSSVTDPYQGLEAKYQLTKKCLQVLADYGFEGVVSVLTKSKLVLRDMDTLKKLKRVLVGLTVTSTDDKISRFFERYAPPVSDRFEALKTLNENGIKTYAFIGPLLPHFTANKTELEKIIKRLAEVGTKNVFIEHLNLSNYLRGRLFNELKGVDEEILSKFYSSQNKKYREEIEVVIKDLLKKYGIKLLIDQVILHKEYQKTKDNLKW